jgi:cell division protein FtsB
MKNLFASRKQIFVIVLILMFIYLITDLNARVTEMTTLVNQRDNMRTEVLALKQTEMALRTQMAYVTSDAAVREWAYEDGHKAMPGDNIIVPLSPSDYVTPTPTPIAVTPEKVENWQVWWALFFGE